MLDIYIHWTIFQKLFGIAAKGFSDPGGREGFFFIFKIGSLTD